MSAPPAKKDAPSWAAGCGQVPMPPHTRAAGGVGLGLTLCRLVAQAHGGDLSLQQAHPGLRAEATLQVTDQSAR